MCSEENFRFQSHELLIELDAATTGIMMLVTAGELHGGRWDDAVVRHHIAVDAWQRFLKLADALPAN